MDDGTSSVTFPESADSSPYILAHVGSYVPAGYIMLDHSPINESSPYSKSVSSIWPKPPPRVIQSWNYLFWKTLRSAFFVQRSPRFGSNLFCLAFREKSSLFAVCICVAHLKCCHVAYRMSLWSNLALISNMTNPQNSLWSPVNQDLGWKRFLKYLTIRSALSGLCAINARLSSANSF